MSGKRCDLSATVFLKDMASVIKGSEDESGEGKSRSGGFHLKDASKKIKPKNEHLFSMAVDKVSYCKQFCWAETIS